MGNNIHYPQNPYSAPLLQGFFTGVGLYDDYTRQEATRMQQALMQQRMQQDQAEHMDRLRQQDIMNGIALQNQQLDTRRLDQADARTRLDKNELGVRQMQMQLADQQHGQRLALDQQQQARLDAQHQMNLQQYSQQQAAIGQLPPEMQTFANAGLMSPVQMFQRPTASSMNPLNQPEVKVAGAQAQISENQVQAAQNLVKSFETRGLLGETAPIPGKEQMWQAAKNQLEAAIAEHQRVLAEQSRKTAATTQPAMPVGQQMLLSQQPQQGRIPVNQLPYAPIAPLPPQQPAPAPATQQAMGTPATQQAIAPATQPGIPPELANDAANMQAFINQLPLPVIRKLQAGQLTPEENEQLDMLYQQWIAKQLQPR